MCSNDVNLESQLDEGKHGPNRQSPMLHEASKIMQDLLQVPMRPITRARDKHLKEALNGLMHGLWSQPQNDLERIGPSSNPNLVHLVQVNNNGLNCPILHSIFELKFILISLCYNLIL